MQGGALRFRSRRTRRERTMSKQFDMRRDAEGWTVFDRWTGEAVILGFAAQVGLTESQATDLADRLNDRHHGCDRKILQLPRKK